LFTLCFHNYLKLIVFGNTILFLTIFSPLYAENLQIGLNNSLTDPGTSTQGVGGPNYNGLPASGGSGTTTTPAQNGSQKFPPPPSSSNNQ
jgi:hypothetical protein